MDVRSLLFAPLSALALALPASAQEALHTFVGDHVGDTLGWSVDGAGDVNKDGIPDVIVGAPANNGTSPPTSGYVRVFSGADGRQLHRWGGDAAADLFGLSVSGAGDVDHDGHADLIVGAPHAGPSLPASVRVFSGRTGDVLLELPGSATWDGLGTSVDAAGRIDADAAADVIVGAPQANAGAGAARIISGADGTTLFDFAGLAPGDAFGACVAGAGDVNDDAVPDVIVGGGGKYVRVFSGADGSVLHHFTSPTVGGSFGAVVRGAGDVDADDFDDLAIAAPHLQQVDILSGRTGLLLRRFTRPAEGFAAALDQVGDLDGDSVPDFAVGAPDDAPSPDFSGGSVFLISGSSGTTLFKFFPGEPGARFGSSVAAAGDLDGDGRPDIVVGAPSAVDDRGNARAFSGKFAGSIVAYGLGCPNGFLITPRIELLGNPLPDGELTLTLSSCPSDSFCNVLLGTGQSDLPLPNGCVLWVQPVLITMVVPLPGLGFPGSGAAALSGRLPAGVPSGTVFTLQAFVADSKADFGFTSTSAIRLTVL